MTFGSTSHGFSSGCCERSRASSSASCVTNTSLNFDTQLEPPLVTSEAADHDQHALKLGAHARTKFLQDQPRLDCLTEPHFVGEDQPWLRLLERA